ncbi:MAG: hypothetical protein LBT89_06305 [Planctomycetaceae bacterium]|jgi:hypothetical protein|nr:hypothetical protein [Planctomycetaceae bacterium]
MAKRKIEPYITERLESQLQPFIDECERRGYPIRDVEVIESIPGVHNSFGLAFDADWDVGMDPGERITLMRDILRETTPQEVHQHMHAFLANPSQEVMAQFRIPSVTARAGS